MSKRRASRQTLQRQRMKPPELVYKKLPARLTRENFPTEFFQRGIEFAVIGPTWDFNPKRTIESYRDEYAKKPEKVARNIGCRPTLSAGEKFCRNPNLITERANHDRPSPLIINGDGGPYHEWFRPSDYEYVAAYDLGLRRDAAGFCLAHGDYEEGKIVVDLMIRREVEEGAEISFAELRGITYDLWDRGFYVACVVSDTWQSEETRQEFESRGFTFRFISTVRNSAPYETLLDLLVDDKLDFYYDPIFDEEFSNLIRNGRKIDHPDHGHKDLADAVAAAVYVISETFSASPMIG